MELSAADLQGRVAWPTLGAEGYPMGEGLNTWSGPMSEPHGMAQLREQMAGQGLGMENCGQVGYQSMPMINGGMMFPSAHQDFTGFPGTQLNQGQGQMAHTLSLCVDTANSARMQRKMYDKSQCQVEGCMNDLRSLKEYYQRYRICDVHLKTVSMWHHGKLQRFCQQCGRFHELSAFDGEHRSCRERLQKHNARRRRAYKASGEIVEAGTDEGAAAGVLYSLAGAMQLE